MCVCFGARIFGRYVIKPNDAIEEPCMIPSVPVIHPFKNPGLLEQARVSLVLYSIKSGFRELSEKYEIGKMNI